MFVNFMPFPQGSGWRVTGDVQVKMLCLSCVLLSGKFPKTQFPCAEIKGRTLKINGHNFT